ncbi:MAG: hypothetical protein FJ221_09040 [Lentisphaerae bacterium]|nr:hypothetical protein [Lentisphaerota bacterium]
MSEPAELTLAAVLALTAHFQAGVDAMKAGDPARAATEMTAVIRAEPGLPELSAGARLLRGQALKARSKTAEALDDFRWLATRDVAPDIRKKAREEYAAAGGKPESLAPEVPPLAEWKRLQEAIRGEQGRQVWNWLAGPFGRSLRILGGMMGEELEAGDVAFWFAEDEAVLVGQAIDEAAGTARLTFREDEQTIHVDWTQDGARWLISGLQHEDGGGGIPQLAVTDVPRLSSEGEKDEAPAAGAGLTPELKAEIDTCIGRLGAADAAVRAGARARLREIGEAAKPQLKARAGDGDPEIATSIRELLGRP